MKIFQWSEMRIIIIIIIIIINIIIKFYYTIIIIIIIIRQNDYDDIDFLIDSKHPFHSQTSSLSHFLMVWWQVVIVIIPPRIVSSPCTQDHYEWRKTYQQEYTTLT